MKKSEFRKSMRFLTESARIAKAYGMVADESTDVPKKVCEGWNRPKVDVGKDGKVVRRDGSFGESVEDGGDGEFSKKVFFLDIRVPHPSDEDDETFEDMKYSAIFTKLADAVKTAKDAYAEYVKEYPEIEVNIWGGEERRPEGDIYGEPWVYCTVKADGCDFSDEQIAEEDAHDDYFLWKAEEKKDDDEGDVKDDVKDDVDDGTVSDVGEAVEDDVIGNIDDVEAVEDVETVELTPEAEEMLERDSRQWSNLGTNMSDEKTVLKNTLICSSSYHNGIVGQSNLIAALKRLEDEGFVSGTDFGVLSTGGFGGNAYWLWYNRENPKVVNAVAEMESELKDYPLLDEDLHSSMESYLCDWYWTEQMSDDDKAEYYEKHGVEVPSERPIPKPDFYNDNGDVTAMVVEQTLADPELRKMAEEYGVELPESYFE